MPKVTIRTTFDRAGTEARIRAGFNHALTAVGMQALKDTTQHVPRDVGTLQEAGIMNSDSAAHDLKFILRWDTPYSRYLFHGEVMYGNPTDRRYGPEKLTFTAALARMEWTKYAHEVYGADWKQVCQNALKGW